MVGDVPVGDGAPVSVQSMTNTDTRDVEATLKQISELEHAGCEIVRVGVPDSDAADALERIVAGTRIPLIADLHFDWRLALLVMEHDIAGIRVNPGTIAKKERLVEIAHEAEERGIAVRVGVNSGSLESRLAGQDRRAEAEALATSALDAAELMAAEGVSNLKISVKASDVQRTLEAYRLVSQQSDWPLHVGLTEAGTLWSGTIKSAVGIGALLAEGIGDTIRVSLTAPPVEEVRVGRKILASLGLKSAGPDVISCPTCARAEFDVIEMASRVEQALLGYSTSITVAVMGCTVNGPGEAREADVGVAGGKEGALLFVKGEMLRRIPLDDMFDGLLAEVKKLVESSGEGEGG
jgi:(E)-4-hydroxy-3-methylbut-2-enyl-diphosphate synthase